MVSKKTKQAKKAAKVAEAASNGDAQTEAAAGPSTSATPVPTSPSSTPPLSAEEEPENIIARAEKVKEQGNTAFKAGRYGEAIDLYTKAIELNPLEPSYLTNRAAAYMALKRFRPALDDCQQAATLQSANPSSKTLLRLARCQLALGSPTPALSNLRTVLSLEPKNQPAIQLQSKIAELESHLKNFDSARTRKDWGMARLALDQCLRNIEGEGGEIPTDWRVWRVELELARGNLDMANEYANDALRLNTNSPEVLALRGLVLFLSGKLAQAVQHVSSALRLDPSFEPAQRLRKRVKDVERLKEEGNVSFKSNRWQEAVEKYTEALERIGKSEDEGKGGQIRATLLSNRATTLVKLEKYDEALNDTSESLVLAPSSFKALRTRARIHLQLEAYEKAVADFKSALEAAESDADARALRGELKKAEAALKRSKTKDYYKILGLKRDCTEVEIKKAYRMMSLKHHPDKGGDEEQFKLVVEAHSVLSDPVRRERYDNGEDEDGMNGGGPGFGGMGGMSQADIAELFAQFGGAGGGFRGGFGGAGGGGYRTHTFSF